MSATSLVHWLTVPGGETIKDMQIVTGCKINIPQWSGSGADVERVTGLIGTRSAIEHAKRAIMEKVRAVVCISKPSRYALILTLDRRTRTALTVHGRKVKISTVAVPSKALAQVDIHLLATLASHHLATRCKPRVTLKPNPPAERTRMPPTAAIRIT